MVSGQRVEISGGASPRERSVEYERFMDKNGDADIVPVLGDGDERCLYRLW